MGNSDTLVIPDIHHKTAMVDAILARHPDIERRVFLGDVYDDFNDTSEIMRHTAMWHKRMLADHRNTFLLGNHDVTYMSGGHLRCSGYSSAKQAAFDLVMRRIDWIACSLSTEVNGWLLSHAGYHPSLYREGYAERMYYERYAITRLDLRDGSHELIEAGRARGGWGNVGGVTWLDWNREFVPIPGVRQLVGHTRGTEPRIKGENVCLDCSLEWYGIIRDDGELELRKTDDADVVYLASELGPFTLTKKLKGT